jgi:hypothetical protein
MDPFFVWLESSSLSVWVRESTSVFAFPIILSFHTIGMGFVAGLSTAVALRILGRAPGVPLMEMRRLFPFLWTAFWINAVSGVVLLIAYPTKALTNPVFYLKLVFIGFAVWAVRSIYSQVFGNPGFQARTQEGTYDGGDRDFLLGWRDHGWAAAGLHLLQAHYALERTLHCTHFNIGS